MTQQQAARGLYGWLMRQVVSEGPPGTRRRWAWLAALSVASLAAEIGSLVSMMLLLGAVFEPAAGGGPLPGGSLPVRHLMLLLLILFALRSVFNYYLQVGRHDLSRRTGLRCAAELTRHTLALPVSASARWDLGTTMSLLAWSATGMAEVLEMAVIGLPLDLLSVGAIVGFLACYRPALTLILLAVFLLYAFPYFAWKDRAEGLAGQRQGIANAFFEALSQALLGLRELKAFRATSRWMERFREFYRQLDRTGDEETRLNEKDGQVQTLLFNALGTLVILGAVLFVLAPALPDTRQRVALTGQVLVFVLAQGILAAPLTSLMYAVRSYRQALPQLVEMRRLLAESEERETAGEPEDLAGFGQIELQGVTVARPDGQRSLEGVSAILREGSLVSLVGTSGAGKSTFLDLLPRFVEPEPGGSLTLGGRRLEEIDLATLRANVVSVAQRPVLFEGSLRENLTLGARRPFSDDELRDILRQAQLDPTDRRLAERGLDTLLTRGAENLSGGEAQRVALARALVAEPRILLLDEATSNLDPLSEARFYRELARSRGGRTVVAVTHRLYALTPLCDQILVLDQGQVVQRGTHAELVAQEGLYARLWEAQIASVRDELRSLSELAAAHA
ncbi:MAG TPA: ATP-binding cassette domain-containing protein [Candidatus Nitrosotenuis sp.]|jgi:ABC-type multidrug transport system fused ATPase/permease subunit|nr:ATP-binding cassette domain-containing protein [Candidatus Nitrosotenuis sp.]